MWKSNRRQRPPVRLARREAEADRTLFWRNPDGCQKLRPVPWRFLTPDPILGAPLAPMTTRIRTLSTPLISPERVPICIMACGPDPEEVSDRAKAFAKSDAAEWFGARGDELIRTFECIAERVVQQPGPVGCQEAAEQWKPDPDAPDEPPKFPPPGIPGRGPAPAPK